MSDDAISTPSATLDSENRTIFFVDASNVAHQGRRKPELINILAVRDDLRRYGTVVLVADASLRHKIDDRVSYERLVNDGTILQVPSGTSADWHIKVLAAKWRLRKWNVVVVSNDRRMNDTLPTGITPVSVLSVNLKCFIDNIFTPTIAEVSAKAVPRGI